MARLCVVLCALFCGFGCAAEDARTEWNETLKDARGDNMQMRGGFSNSSDDYPLQTKSRN